MNQSYRVVWQASTNTSRVVSELAKARGKSTSGKTGRAKMLAHIVTVSLGMLGADAALANAENTEETSAGSQFQVSCLGADGRIQRHGNASGKNNCKDNTVKINPSISAAALQGQIASSSPLDASEQAGSRTAAPPPASGIDVAADATGAQSQTGSSVAPRTAVAVDSISAGKAGSERQITNLAAGTTDTDAVNLGQVKLLVGDGSSQRYLQVSGKNDGSDNALANGYNASAIGVQAAATGAGATALGSQSHAMGDYSISSGYGSVAKGDNSIASGYSAVASDEAAVAIGMFSVANGDGSVALGSSAATQGSGGIAIGNNASVAQADNIAIGRDSTAQNIQSIALGARSQAVGPLTTAIGFAAGAGSLGSMAIGSGTTVGFNSEFSTAIGTGATISDDSMESTALGAGSGINGGTQSLATGYAAMAFGSRSTAMGAYARVGNDDNTAVGFNSRAGFEDPLTGVWFNNYATALGASSQALATGSSALGADSLALAQNSVALGYQSLADRDNSVSVGSAGSERQITNVAAGTAATDAVNKTQLDGLADSLSEARHYLSVNGNGDGSDDAVSFGSAAMAIGAGAKAAQEGGSAVGFNAQANGLYSSAFGAEAQANGDGAPVAIGAFSTAQGDFSTALGGEAIAVGNGSTAVGARSIALGNDSVAVGRAFSEGEQSVAIGLDARSIEKGGVAIGSNYQPADGEITFGGAALAAGRNAVALGAGAEASGFDSAAIGARARAQTDNSVALGAHSLADRADTVSVGNAGLGQTRQITNVGSGTQENDAVNVGQLFRVGDSVAQMLGGGAMMGTSGFVGPVFGVQGGSYHNVGDALGALDGALDSLGNRVSNLENGGAAESVLESKPVAKTARDVAPPSTATPPAAGAVPDTGKDIVTQDQLDDVKDYADAGNKQTLGSANQYTDRKLADKVSQSDFNEFKGNVDQRFDKVNKKISRVGAMASAMAGMAGSIAAAPSNENRISAAIGGYGGQTALSLGYAKRLSTSGAVLIGGSIASGGESSGTVGVSFGW